MVRARGFARGRTPCVATLRLAEGQEALDGQGRRGVPGEEVPGVRLVAASAPRAGPIGGSGPLSPRVAPGVLTTLPWAGRPVTGEALAWQRHLWRTSVAAGGDSRMKGKATPPPAGAAIARLCAEPPPGETFRVAEPPDQHGDRQGGRRLGASTALQGSLDGPRGSRSRGCASGRER